MKLLDFGIAHLLESQGDGVQPLTRAGESVLTPAYAAPEQVNGGEVTTATDVYALGVLLYLLLAGRHPLEPDLEQPAALLRAIVETDAPRMSERVVDADPRLVAHRDRSPRLVTPHPSACARRCAATWTPSWPRR